LQPSVYLVGYRGSGKTAVGRLLAARLGWPFCDADLLLEARAGRSIASIFAADGELAFRDLESAVIDELAARSLGGERLVVATGGGIVLRPRNVEVLRRSGIVVWLEASAGELRRRIGLDPRSASQRPALSPGGTAVDEVEAVLRAREPLYRAAAHHSISTDGRSPAEVMEAVLPWLTSP
jgi:shikimate kinase